MQSDSFRESLEEFHNTDCTCLKNFEDLYKIHVSEENIGILEDLICSVEMRIASLNQVSKKLKLKKRAYYLRLVEEIPESL